MVKHPALKAAAGVAARHPRLEVLTAGAAVDIMAAAEVGHHPLQEAAAAAAEHQVEAAVGAALPSSSTTHDLAPWPFSHSSESSANFAVHVHSGSQPASGPERSRWARGGATQRALQAFRMASRRRGSPHRTCLTSFPLCCSNKDGLGC